MSTPGKKYTLGFVRSDGDLDVLCTFNLDNVHGLYGMYSQETLAQGQEILEQLVHHIAFTFNATIYERDDVPDVISPFLIT